MGTVTRMRIERIHLNMTQEQLAIAAGVSQPVVSGLEGGDLVSVDSLRAVAQVLKAEDPLALLEKKR